MVFRHSAQIFMQGLSHKLLQATQTPTASPRISHLSSCLFSQTSSNTSTVRPNCPASITSNPPSFSTTFTQQVGIQYPIICGAMYPCSNPELIAAVSEAGGIGIIQPISLSYAHGYNFKEGLQYIRSLTRKPIGMNLLLEKSTKKYAHRLMTWLEEALEADVRFFVTALGNPKEATELIHQAGGIVYHNVTHETWAKKALESGVDGLICVNERAGGHAGTLCSHQLYQALSPLGVPLIAAGGIGDEKAFHKRLQQGYAGVQMGTRFIATHECNAHPSHKQAIIEATASDIVFTDKLSSIPCSVIKNPLTQHLEEPTGPIQGRSNKYLKK